LKEKQKILIATGIFPPKIGGPAQYAKNLKETFEKMGHVVNVKTYGIENKLPTGIRHSLFFLKIILALLFADAVFILDTFSVGLPTVLACKIFSKRGIIRTGGDFLWEQYVERTGRKILLKNFYDTEKNNFSLKEKMIFKLTKWTLHNSSKVIFSTEWQRDIFTKAYNLKDTDTCIVENYYGEKESDKEFDSKIFLSSSRKIFLKNSALLHKIFDSWKAKRSGAILLNENIPFEEFIEKMRTCYAVIIISFSEISPNIILDAIRCNKPFICTREVGIYDRIKDAGIFVDPLNEKEIEEAVLNLLTEESYKKAKEKVKNFNFIHTWNKIAEEFIEAYKSL